MPSFLDLVNINPNEIDSILLTHMHPDHSNGLLDVDGNRFLKTLNLLFQNVTLTIGTMMRPCRRPMKSAGTVFP
ncbi:MAG: hypothetical protein CM15mP62_26430 [Rhodospirillaceae bacterium]|nr:MAG: hypothetical protein CM15mP62_26430 [Rhodospirillaceae bacterium]